MTRYFHHSAPHLMCILKRCFKKQDCVTRQLEIDGTGQTFSIARRSLQGISKITMKLGHAPDVFLQARTSPPSAINTHVYGACPCQFEVPTAEGAAG